MGFLKKLLGGNASVPPVAEALKPRAPRVRPQPLDSLVFVIDGGTRCGVANISTTGVGLLSSALPKIPEPNSLVEGAFDFGGKLAPARLRAVRSGSEVAGFVFEGETESLRKMIREYFEIQISAMELVKVDPSTLKSDPEGDVHWYRGRNNCDLYFVAKEGRVLRFTLSFFGHYLEGSPGKKLKLGRIEEDEGIGQGIKGAEIVRWQSAATPELLGGAQKFVAHVVSLSLSERDELIRMLRV